MFGSVGSNWFLFEVILAMTAGKQHGTWYIRIDGMVDPTPYQGKAAANAAGLELKKQPGNENKLFMLTTKA
jgi:hypothetical protein